MRLRLRSTITSLIAAVVCVLGSTNAAQAGEEPPGCTSAGTGVSIEALIGGLPTLDPVVEGQSITYRVNLFNPSPAGCNFFGGQLSVTLPDGTVVPLAGFGGPTPDVPIVGFGAPFSVESTVPYIVSEADVVAGVLTARADYGSTLNQPLQLNGTFLTDPEQNTASATTSLPLPLADVEINKTADRDFVCEGQNELVTYSYTVTTGLGSRPLANVVVTDDQCAAVVRGLDTPGNNDDILEIGEVWNYTCQTPVNVPTLNTVTVNAVTDPTGVPVSDEDTFFVDIFPAVTVSVNPPSPEICAGESIEICAVTAGGTLPITYAWTGPGGFMAATECVTISVAGIYTVTVTDANGCTDTANAELIVNPNPDCTITADQICELTAGNMASVPNAGPGASYAWTIMGGNITAGQGTPTITYTHTGGPLTLGITITDANGCTCSNSTPVTVNPNPDCTITAPPICDGSPGNMASVPDAGPGATYAWTIMGGMITAGQGTPTITYVHTGGALTLGITIVDANGCTCTSSTPVTVNPNPDCTISAAPVCPDSVGNMASVPDAGPGATYTWGIVGGAITNGQGTPTITYSVGPGPTTISITIVDANGCTCMNSIDIAFNAVPSCVLTIDAVCPDSIGNMASVPNAGPGATYLWNIVGGAITNGQGTPTITFSVGAGPATISVTVTTADGCSCSNSAPVSFDGEPDCTITAPPICELTAGNMASVPNAGPGASYAWTIMGGNITAGQGTPTITYTHTGGPLTLGITITDANGCTCSNSTPVTVNPNPDCTITAPPICELGSGSASVPNAGPGATYTWGIVGGIINAGQGTPSITYTHTGGPLTLSITIVDANGCECSDSTPVTLNPNPDCTITAPPICELGSGTASVPNAGPGATYTWSVANGTIDAGQGTPSISYTHTGGPLTISIIIVDGNGCMCSDSTPVTINPEPDCTITANPNPVCIGSSGNTASVPNAGPGASYSWSIVNGTITAGQGTPSITYTHTGGPLTICVTITDANGCTCDACIDVPLSGTGMVGDFIWEDLDENGQQDAGEPGIDGVRVSLFRKLGGGGLEFIGNQVTAGGGLYLFTDLCAGDYQIVVTPPPGFTPTTSNVPPDDTIDSDCVDGMIMFTLPTDDTIDLTLDCGFFRLDMEREHPGWNAVDNLIELTGNEPAYWSAFTGEPKGLSPFTILDPSADPLQQGRPDPDGSSDRVLRGLIYAWAVNAAGEEITWNHLFGTADVVNYRDGTAWEYNAWAFQSLGTAQGAPTGTPGVLNLDGVEYVPGFSLLLLDFLGAGSQALSGGNPFAVIETDTDLTLHPLGLDVRQETDGPVTTKASFVIWNENETQLTGLDRCITCWDETLLSLYAQAQNHFLLANLQTDKGKARIDGLQSQLCDVDFDSGDQLPLGDDPRDLVSSAASLLGVAAKHLSFDGGARHDDAGFNLIGLGTQSGVIRYDVVTDPPPTSTDGSDTMSPVQEMLSILLPDADEAEQLEHVETTRDAGRVPTPAAPLAVGLPDRVSGTEKGSLLIWSKVELRWDAAGNLIQDTFLTIGNDWNNDVRVKLYFVNGDPPLEATVIGP